MRTFQRLRWLTSLVGGLLLAVQPIGFASAGVKADEVTPAEDSASVYGALFEAGNLVAENDGSNNEAVVFYVPSVDGFIAATTNQGENNAGDGGGAPPDDDGNQGQQPKAEEGQPGEESNTGSEWWTANKYGLDWKIADSNPLEEYGCTQVGRHGVAFLNDEVYIGAACEAGGLIFKVTGLEEAEVVFTRTAADGQIAAGYPTAAVLEGTMYFFFNGGFVKSDDGVSWEEVTDTEGEPDDQSAVPLEASSPKDGVLYVAFTNGDVMIFDGDSYTKIGEDYLEQDTTQQQEGGYNLPAIEIFDGNIYVGNQDTGSGASIFERAIDDEDTSNDAWEEIIEAGVDNTIINKMEISEPIDGQRYLVYFTSNGQVGTQVTAIGPDNEEIPLIESGLGGDSAANNREVVSLTSRVVKEGEKELLVMVFGTQNTTDQTKIYVLNIGGEEMAVTPTEEEIISAPVEEEPVEETDETTASLRAKADVYTAKGEIFKLKVDASQVTVGDIFTLYVNGKKVDQVKAKSTKVILKYVAAKKLKNGKTFKVEVGRKLAYGKGDSQALSVNIVKGATTVVGVKK